jgi:N-ethylmaleimide reductase
LERNTPHETAKQSLAGGDFDLSALGRPFIANPGFIHKLENEEPLQTYETSPLSELL